MAQLARQTHEYPPSNKHPDSLAFGPFRLDCRGGRLIRGGETIPLRPKTWSVLLYLAQRPGNLISKDEILDAIWPDVAVTPDTLTKSIGELRRALADESSAPRYIETVHRRGFRFIATAHVPAVEVEADSLETVAPKSKPFVGRERESEQLAELYRKVCSGQRQLVFLTGAAGIGKSRLLNTFLSWSMMQENAAPVWIGRGACIEQHGIREAYMPVFDALERLLQQAQSDRVMGLLHHAAPTWLAQMPWLLEEGGDKLAEALQANRPERMLREFIALIERMSAEAVVVLALEDLHWSDPSTVDLLTALAQRRESARLLIVATYRPAEAAAHEHVLAQAVRIMQLRDQCVDLPLHELSPADVARYLELRFPGADFVATVAPALHHYTDGVPLFVTATIEHMLSRGWILDTAPGWALSITPEQLALEIPEDARRLIDLQLGGLAPADRRLLEAASVAGTEFSVRTVATALGWTESEAERTCEDLARSQRFLHASGRRTLPDGAVTQSYAFNHELYRQTAYAEIPQPGRHRLHQKTAEALELTFGENAPEVAAELAMHFERAGLPARALVYLKSAAARADRRFAWREATKYLETAIAMAEQLDDPQQRQQEELNVRLLLWPLLKNLHGYASDQLRSNCDRALALCDAIGTPQQLFEITYALGHVDGLRADKVRIPAMLARLEELAARLDTPEHHQLAAALSARLLFMCGKYSEACGVAERLWRSTPKPQHTPGGELSRALVDMKSHYAMAQWFLGHTREARSQMQVALAEAEALGSPATLASVLAHCGLWAMFRRQPDETLAFAERLGPIANEHGFAFYQSIEAGLRGSAMVQRGAVAEAVDILNHARTLLQQTGSRIFSTHILASLAEAYLHAGAREASLLSINEALLVAETTLDHLYWPELWRLKGEILLTAAMPSHSRRAKASAPSGNWDEIEHCLAQAVDVARQMQTKALELRATTSLAAALAVRKRQSQARQMLSEICAWFGDDADNVDLVAANKLLARLSAK